MTRLHSHQGHTSRGQSADRSIEMHQRKQGLVATRCTRETTALWGRLATLFVMTLITLSLLLALGTSVARADGSDERTALIKNVITTQVSAFRADDGETAFEQAAPNIQRMFRTPARFMAMVRNGYGMIYNPVEYSFEALRTKDGKTIQPVIFADRDRQAVRALYEMERIDGTWRISGVVLEAIEDQMI